MKNQKIGVLYGVLAYVAWGFLPVYWKLLRQIPPYEILAHRVFWSFVFVGALIVIRKDLSAVKDNLKDRKSIINLVLSAVIITINWGTYIWAVNSNHMIEASMGYYINPLMVITLGMTVLKEKLNLMQYLSIALASTGVVIITLQYGRVPWIALLLAASFALYGLFKKLMKAEALVGLAMETAVIMPFATAYIVFRLINGTSGVYTVSAGTLILLLLSGVATATPLLWYAMGAKKVKLSTMGFLQYISPTISLFLGVFVYGEQFTGSHLISFGFIWAGLIVYSISTIKFGERKAALPEEM